MNMNAFLRSENENYETVNPIKKQFYGSFYSGEVNKIVKAKSQNKFMTFDQFPLNIPQTSTNQSQSRYLKINFIFNIYIS